MDNFPLLTAREAAFVLEIEHDVVMRELDVYAEQLHKIQLSSGPVRQLRFQEVAFLRAIAIKGEKGSNTFFSATGKAELYRLLVVEEHRPGMVRFREVFGIDLEKISGELRKRLDVLASVRASVDYPEDGAPLIKGTRIEVYRVAALATTSPDEAKFEYPSLSMKQIEDASLFATIYPKPGRPYPSHSLKRMLLSAEFDELNSAVAKGRKEGAIYGKDKPESPKGMKTAQQRKAKK
jgi:hypothetical protein